MLHLSVKHTSTEASRERLRWNKELTLIVTLLGGSVTDGRALATGDLGKITTWSPENQAPSTL